MSGQAQQSRCKVVDAGKLPPAIGGGAELCAAIQRAVSERAPNARYSAIITVRSRTSLAATLVVNGRALPEQRFGVMDRELNSGSIQRFAASLAVEVSKAIEA